MCEDCREKKDVILCPYGNEWTEFDEVVLDNGICTEANDCDVSCPFAFDWLKFLRESKKKGKK